MNILTGQDHKGSRSADEMKTVIASPWIVPGKHSVFMCVSGWFGMVLYFGVRLHYLQGLFVQAVDRSNGAGNTTWSKPHRVPPALVRGSSRESKQLLLRRYLASLRVDVEAKQGLTEEDLVTISHNKTYHKEVRP